jgi:hypothetical protein
MSPAQVPDQVVELRPAGTPNEFHVLITLATRDLRSLPAPRTLYMDAELAVRPRMGDFADYEFVETVPAPDGYVRLRFAKTVTGPELEQRQVRTNNAPPGEFFDELDLRTGRTRTADDAALPASPGGGLVAGVTKRDEDTAAAQQELTTWEGRGQKTLVGSRLDMWSGQLVDVERRLVRHGYRGRELDINGMVEEVEARDTQWAVATRRPVVGGGAGAVRSYQGVRQYYWPAVLQSFRSYPILDRSGNIVRVLWDYDLLDEYNGPCRTLVEERWTPVPPFAVIPDTMDPTEIRWSLVFSQGVIPACLHPRVTIEETTGSNNRFEFAVNRVIVPATRLLQRPASVISRSDIRPYQGGFLQTLERTFAPGV